MRDKIASRARWSGERAREWTLSRVARAMERRAWCGDLQRRGWRARQRRRALAAMASRRRAPDAVALMGRLREADA